MTGGQQENWEWRRAGKLGLEDSRKTDNEEKQDNWDPRTAGKLGLEDSSKTGNGGQQENLE